MIADEMAAAHADLQTFMVPPQRVAWVMREFENAGIQPQTRPGEDGYIIFTVDERGAAIIERIMAYQSKRRFGSHPVHKAVNTVMALVMTALVAGIVFMSFATGAFLYLVPSIALLIFVWWARSVLNSDKSAARLFKIVGRK